MPTTSPFIGFVSDENYLALADVSIEIEQANRCVAVTKSSARGAIYADLPAGEYRVTLAKDGFGAKRVNVRIDPASPIQFRLLSDSLYGYAWPKWIKSGGIIEFRVHSPEPYRLSLWRYGKSKELIRLIGWFDEHGPRANLQILPDEDFTQTGVQWNQHGFNPAAFRVAAPDRSGLYYFHVETESGKFMSFPWVVAPQMPRSSIAVLASTNTWNAYNNFGGRSNYINPTELPPTPSVNARQDLSRYAPGGSKIWNSPNESYRSVSFDRPEPFNQIPKDTKLEDPIRGRQACHLAEAEWKLLGWLEREGFEYDLYSDHQLHGGELNLEAYKTLILSTHPEYWSRQAYEHVKRWVFERGGKLMYLGGNGIDCEVEFTDDSSLHFKTWLPTPAGIPFEENGKVYDCRFHHSTGESPADLLGVVFTEAGATSGAPYRVIDASHWIFTGTGLKNGDLFGQQSQHERCPGGASGHETDKRTVSSPKNSALLARGENINSGGAEMIYHETPSGGAVFSVGSINWPASLIVDEAISRITRNVLQRFAST